MRYRHRQYKQKFFTCVLLFFGLLLGGLQHAYGQHAGLRYSRNFSPNDYSGYPQNWSVLQDKRGIIYVGNNGGLLQFDGVSWRLINIPDWEARSMAMDDSGTIYVGGKNEIGFLIPDAKGTLQYVSLVDQLNDKQKNFSSVWRTHSTKEGIYFHTSKFLFRWNSKTKTMHVWQPDDRFNASFNCRGTLFIRQGNIGLMLMKNDSLKLAPGGEFFAAKKVYMMVPYDDKKILMGTRSKGFYLYDGITAVPFPTEADDYIKEKKLYYGTRLSSSSAEPNGFALATLQGGLVIVDSLGKLKEIFNKTYGLPDENVKYVFEDAQANLWLGLNNGVSKIEYAASPISFYDRRSNLPGIVLTVTKHGPNNDIYVGTTSGLYSRSSVSPGKFIPVPGMSGNCFSILSVGDSLLAAATIGVFQIKNHGKQRIGENSSYVLLRTKLDPNRIWVGTAFGLVSLYLYSTTENKTHRWTGERKFEKITQPIRTIAEDKKGNLWLGTLTTGVFKVDFPNPGTITNPAVTRYDTSHGLPPKEINVFFAAGHVMFATGKGIFRFNEKDKVFIPDTTLGNEFAGGSKGVFRIAEDKHKNIWLHSEHKNIRAIPGPGGAFVLDSTPFLRIPHTQVNYIYPDPGGNITWFAGNDGLIRYDTRVKKNYRSDFSTFIRQVRVNGITIFNGYKSKPLLPVIAYKDRNLRFTFAAPFFENEPGTTYQFFLEGYDNDWSAGTSETKKDYTNLDSGSYRFRVRAKNVYENVSREAVFQFKILPPWYNTWWAFLLYALMFFFLVYVIVEWRSGKLEKEKQRLEGVVEERTKEINRKNRELQKQTRQCQVQSVKLQEMDTIKSRFFANISHEFRTPLTLIIGPLEQILGNTRYKEYKELEETLTPMLRNSKQLLTLINRLLDLSKFDSGKIRLQAAPQNIISFLKGILASFESLAVQKELELTFGAEEENVTLYFDPQRLEEMVANLLINAVKFTPPGGQVTVSTRRNLEKEAHFPLGSLEISVRDTGIGIPGNQLAHIFDRFYQVEGSREGYTTGTGIGLALAKEVVELHHGEIQVQSSKGETSGTEFIIRLPMGKEHLKAEEIVDAAEIPSVQDNDYDYAPPPGESPDVYMTEKDELEETKDDTELIESEGEKEKNVILVVEDNADVRKYIRGPLEPLYTVVEAKEGQEGIRKAKEIVPDLIISDVMMPGVDGYELCNVLKKDVNTSHIPIILLTAKVSEDSIVQGLETGADDYITKPFSTKILSVRIKNLVDLRRQLQEKIQRQMMLQPAEISISSIDKEFINELMELIVKNLSDPEFNVDQLGKKLYMSRASLYRKIQALTGESPIQFIRSYRLKRATQLLKANFGNITEVAFEVGFSSTAYFTKCFKEKFHQLPSDFQANEATGKGTL